jgi:hypothetical protein
MWRFYEMTEAAQPAQVDNANQLSVYIELYPQVPAEGLGKDQKN